MLLAEPQLPLSGVDQHTSHHKHNSHAPGGQGPGLRGSGLCPHLLVAKLAQPLVPASDHTDPRAAAAPLHGLRLAHCLPARPIPAAAGFVGVVPRGVARSFFDCHFFPCCRVVDGWYAQPMAHPLKDNVLDWAHAHWHVDPEKPDICCCHGRRGRLQPRLLGEAGPGPVLRGRGCGKPSGW
jgi:hypothetical protein